MNFTARAGRSRRSARRNLRRTIRKIPRTRSLPGRWPRGISPCSETETRLSPRTSSRAPMSSRCCIPATRAGSAPRHPPRPRSRRRKSQRCSRGCAPAAGCSSSRNTSTTSTATISTTSWHPQDCASRTRASSTAPPACPEIPSGFSPRPRPAHRSRTSRPARVFTAPDRARRRVPARARRGVLRRTHIRPARA